MHVAEVSDVASERSENDVQSDRRSITRGGIFTMGGSLFAGVMGFALNIVLGRYFGAHGSGVFFEAVSIFIIVNGIAVVGSDTGTLRLVAARRSLHAHTDVWSILRITTWPVLLWSATLAVLIWFTSGPISERLLAEDAGLLEGYLKVAGITLIFSALGQAALGGSRGFGSVRPYIALYQVGLSTARIAFVVLVGALGSSSAWLMPVWCLPLVVIDLLAIGYVVRRAQADLRTCTTPAADTSVTSFREIWRFNVLRGIASFFETCIVWIDVLVVGYFLGPAMAGAYAAASRFITTGTMAMEAMRIGSANTIAEAFAHGDKVRANQAYQLSSVWVVLLSWPVFFGLATFAPFILGVIGDDFLVAAPAMVVMSLGILVYLLMGNINALMLMAGRSDITATNSFFTVILNLALNLVLVPKIGLIGAAIAWSVSLAFDSTLCLLRGYRNTSAVPPWRALLVAALTCAGAFGLTGLVVRAIGEQDIVWFVGYGVVSLCVYLVALNRLRGQLHLQDLPTIWRRR